MDHYAFECVKHFQMLSGEIKKNRGLFQNIRNLILTVELFDIFV